MAARPSTPQDELVTLRSLLNEPDIETRQKWVRAADAALRERDAAKPQSLENALRYRGPDESVADVINKFPTLTPRQMDDLLMAGMPAGVVGSAAKAGSGVIGKLLKRILGRSGGKVAAQAAEAVGSAAPSVVGSGAEAAGSTAANAVAENLAKKPGGWLKKALWGGGATAVGGVITGGGFVKGSEWLHTKSAQEKVAELDAEEELARRKGGSTTPGADSGAALLTAAKGRTFTNEMVAAHQAAVDKSNAATTAEAWYSTVADLMPGPESQDISNLSKHILWNLAREATNAQELNRMRRSQAMTSAKLGEFFKGLDADPGGRLPIGPGALLPSDDMVLAARAAKYGIEWLPPAVPTSQPAEAKGK